MALTLQANAQLTANRTHISWPLPGITVIQRSTDLRLWADYAQSTGSMPVTEPGYYRVKPIPRVPAPWGFAVAAPTTNFMVGATPILALAIESFTLAGLDEKECQSLGGTASHLWLWVGTNVPPQGGPVSRFCVIDGGNPLPWFDAILAESGFGIGFTDSFGPDLTDEQVQLREALIKALFTPDSFRTGKPYSYRVALDTLFFHHPEWRQEIITTGNLDSYMIP